MTGTRSALLALLVLLPVLLFILARYRRLLAFASWPRHMQVVVALVLTLGVWGMGSVPSGSALITQANLGNTALERSFIRAASMTEGKEYTERSFSIRAQMWMATARMMLDRPWSGVGAGAWEVQIPLHQRQYTVLETDYYAHNEFLQLLSEDGVIIGGLVLAYLLAYLLHTALALLKIPLPTDARPPDPATTGTANLRDAPLRAVLLSVFLCLLIVSAAGFPWHLATGTALLGLGLGALTAVDAWQPATLNAQNVKCLPPRPLARALPWATAAGLALAVGLTLLAWQAERSIVHAIHLGTFLGQTLPPPAQPEAQRKQEMLTSLRKGIALHPHYRKFTAIAAEQLSAFGDYANAVWVLESVVASRPHVAALWSGLAYNYARLGQHDKATAAFQQVKRLKPGEPSTATLHATLLSLGGQDTQAQQVLQSAMDHQQLDFELLQTAYALGLKLNDKRFALQALTLFHERWPQHAADTFLRMGRAYAQGPTPDDANALRAFRQGIAAVPAKDKPNYIAQVPERFRGQL